MQDGVSAVNALVDKAANGNQSSGEGGQQQQQQQQIGGEGSQQQQQGSGEGGQQQSADGGQQQAAPDKLTELMKEYGVETEDELRNHLASLKKEGKSEEEKKREEELYTANLNRYAVENGLLTNEQIIERSNLVKKADRDLVFERFANDIRAEIEEDIRSESADKDEAEIKAEIEKEIKDAFDIEYPLDSSSAKARERALNKVKKEAEEIRKPLESSFKEAKSKFDDEQSVRQVYPTYQKKINELVEKSIQPSVKFFNEKVGDEDINVEIDLTDQDRKDILEAIAKKVTNHNTFSLFNQKKEDDIKAIIQESVDYYIWSKYGDVGKKKIAEIYESRGLKKGSTVGAQNSFVQNQGGTGTAHPAKVDPKQAAIDSTRVKK